LTRGAARNRRQGDCRQRRDDRQDANNFDQGKARRTVRPNDSSL
jgi:hypothetical protein